MVVRITGFELPTVMLVPHTSVWIGVLLSMAVVGCLLLFSILVWRDLELLLAVG